MPTKRELEEAEKWMLECAVSTEQDAIDLESVEDHEGYLNALEVASHYALAAESIRMRIDVNEGIQHVFDNAAKSPSRQYFKDITGGTEHEKD